MSNPRPLAECGPVERFVRPSSGFRCGISSLYILTTCPYFDNLKFDIFDAGGPQYHFITSVLRAGRFPYVHRRRGAKCFTSFLISTLVPLALNLLMTSHLRSGLRYQTVVTIAVRTRTLSVH